MAFPDTWLQAWLWLEFAGSGVEIPSNTYFTASCFWFRLFSGTFPATSSEISDLCDNTAEQLWFACSFTSVQLLNSKVQIFGESPSDSFSGFRTFTAGVNSWEGLLPSSVNVTIQRRVGVFDDQPFGRFYLPHVPEAAVAGNFVRPPFDVGYENAAVEFNSQIFNATSSWRPVIASYRDVAAYDFDICQPAQRVALIRKRARPRAWTNPQFNGPKPPPM